VIKFLLDANLSPQTADFLRNLGFNTKSITEDKLGHLGDEEVIKLAKRQKRVVITFDLDLGEIYHAKERGKVGIVVIRTKNQTVENVNKILDNFLKIYKEKLSKNPTSLVVIKKPKVRFVLAKSN